MYPKPSQRPASANWLLAIGAMSTVGSVSEARTGLALSVYLLPRARFHPGRLARPWLRTFGRRNLASWLLRQARGDPKLRGDLRDLLWGIVGCEDGGLWRQVVRRDSFRGFVDHHELFVGLGMRAVENRAELEVVVGENR